MKSSIVLVAFLFLVKFAWDESVEHTFGDCNKSFIDVLQFFLNVFSLLY